VNERVSECRVASLMSYMFPVCPCASVDRHVDVFLFVPSSLDGLLAQRGEQDVPCTSTKENQLYTQTQVRNTTGSTAAFSLEPLAFMAKANGVQCCLFTVQ